MADKTISGLPVGAPLATDEFAIQKTGGGVNEKYTLEAIRVAMRAAAEAHTGTPNVQAITTTPVPITGFDTSTIAVGITVAIAGGVATATVNADKDGPYRVTFDISISSADNFTPIFTLYKNNIATHINTHRKLDSGGGGVDEGSASFNTLIDLVAGDEMVMRIEADIGTADVTYDAMNFTLQRI